MKTRTGFVSNSSSASFVIKWKAKSNIFGKKKLGKDIITTAIGYLFACDVKLKNGYPIHHYDESLNVSMRQLVDNTRVIDLKEKILLTEVFTGTFNTISDFGTGIRDLLFILNIETDEFELLNVQMNRE